MEKTILILAELIISGIAVVACLIYLATGISTTTITNGTQETVTGIYNVLGTVPTVEEADDNIHVVPDGVESAATSNPPVVFYNNYIIKVWDVVSFKELFKVKINDITYEGTEEATGRFNIRIEDVVNKNDISVLTIADRDISNEGDSITTVVLYNTSDDTITFMEAGIYKIRIKVTDFNGNVTETTVAIPVEINF